MDAVPSVIPLRRMELRIKIPHKKVATLAVMPQSRPDWEHSFMKEVDPMIDIDNSNVRFSRLSNAPTLVSPHSSSLGASDKALTSFDHIVLIVRPACSFKVLFREIDDAVI